MLACVGVAPGIVATTADATPTARVVAHGQSHIRIVGSTAKTKLAPGVTLWHQTLADGGRSDQVTLLGIDLNAHGVQIEAASPGGLVGSERATVKSQANEVHALAGVNADFFDLDNDDGEPRGVFVRSGQLIKSPKSWRNANLYISQSGNATIGPLTFTGSVVRHRAGTRAVRRSLYSVNSLKDAQHGRLSLLTDDLGTRYLPRSCAVAVGRTIRGVRTITSVRPDTWTIPVLTASTWVLTSCRDDPATWIRGLRRGDTLTLTAAIGGGTPLAAVSGGSVLVKNSHSYRDPEGEQLPYTGDNAETFGCVSADHRHVLLGAVDGYTQASAGLTYSRLTDYMVALKCYSGIVLDGGGSTTLVARLPGSSKATVQNVPAQQPPRLVADSLVVLTTR